MGYVNIISRKAERPGGKEYGAHTAMGTKVIDAETGKLIDGIRKMVITLDVEEAVTAEIDIFPNSVNIEHVKANFRIVDIAALDSSMGYRQQARVPIKINWFKKVLWNLFFKGKDNGNN